MNLNQLPTEQLVGIILEQQQVIEQLMQAVNHIQGRLHQDSETTSSPPSTSLLKKPEKAKTSEQTKTAKEESKRKAGGQPGHVGKTRKGFGRVDRYEIVRSKVCLNCGNLKFAGEPVAVQVQQMAQLVSRPIEIVEYQQHSCQCVNCGQIYIVAKTESVVGQDLGVSLQGLLVWLGNYGHLSYEKQQFLLRELGDIDIGVGTLQATNQRVFEAVQPAVNELRDWVQQPHVHVDEFPWFEHQNRDGVDIWEARFEI